MYKTYKEEWTDRTSEFTCHVHSNMDTGKEFSIKQIRDMEMQDAQVCFPITYFSNGDDDPTMIDNPLGRIMEATGIAEIMASQGIIKDVDIKMSAKDAPRIQCTIRMPCRESLELPPDDYQMLCNTVLVQYAIYRIRDALRRHMAAVVSDVYEIKPKAPSPSDTADTKKVH